MHMCMQKGKLSHATCIKELCLCIIFTSHRRQRNTMEEIKNPCGSGHRTSTTVHYCNVNSEEGGRFALKTRHHEHAALETCVPSLICIIGSRLFLNLHKETGPRTTEIEGVYYDIYLILWFQRCTKEACLTDFQGDKVEREQNILSAKRRTICQF